MQKDTRPPPIPLASANGPSATPSLATALPVDPATLSDEMLEKLIEEAQTLLGIRKAKREADFFALVEEQARALNIAPARLIATLRAKAGAFAPNTAKPDDGRRFVKAKYRNPKDPSETWAGRGNPPKWYADHVAAGGTEDDMRIPEGEE